MKSRSSLHLASSRGFTLIELLTVIAIIGILAAIIIPTVGKVRESARASQCVSNMRQTAMALRICAEDNRGQLPPANADSTSPAPWTTASNTAWSEHPIFRTYLATRTGGGNNQRHEVMTCPSNNYDEVSGNSTPIANTYAMGAAAGGLNQWNNDINQRLPRSMSTLRNPTLGVFLLESRVGSNTFKTALPVVQRGGFFNSIAPAPTSTDVQFWHGGKNRSNVAFADGSVRGFTAAELDARYTGANVDARFQMAAGL